MNSTRFFKSLVIASVVLLGLVTPSSHGQDTYEVAGPFTSTGAPAVDNQGTFTVSLELSVVQDDLNCFFNSFVNIVLPIRGEGFQISNIQATDSTDLLIPTVTEDGVLVLWQRGFPGSVMETEVTGVLFTFDISFADDFDGVASYTIGESGFSGMFDVMCTDENGVPVGGDGDLAGVTNSTLNDNLGGVTFDSEGGVTPPFILGDINGDGLVNFLDINPFLSLLSNGEFSPAADFDMNGSVGFTDIAGFIDRLLNG